MDFTEIEDISFNPLRPLHITLTFSTMIFSCCHLSGFSVRHAMEPFITPICMLLAGIAETEYCSDADESPSSAWVLPFHVSEYRTIRGATIRSGQGSTDHNDVRTLEFV